VNQIFWRFDLERSPTIFVQTKVASRVLVASEMSALIFLVDI